jgi:hypothetical protein
MNTVYGQVQQYQYSQAVSPSDSADFDNAPASILVLADPDTAVTIAVVPVDNDNADPEIHTVKGSTYLPGLFRRVLANGSALGSPAVEVRACFRVKPE